jgi:hypothetical protein
MGGFGGRTKSITTTTSSNKQQAATNNTNKHNFPTPSHIITPARLDRTIIVHGVGVLCTRFCMVCVCRLSAQTHTR